MKHFLKQFSNLKKIEFWCDLIIYFCVFSIFSHVLIEIPYCLIMDALFGIIPDDCGVWGYPLEPFMIYGIAAIIIIMFIVPLCDLIGDYVKNKLLHIACVFVICTLLALVMELSMGLLFNQPIDGEYPLWINEGLPGNILNQAWIVNDILLGACCVIFIFIIYRPSQKFMKSIDSDTHIRNTLIIVILFFINLYVTYGIFNE